MTTGLTPAGGSAKAKSIVRYKPTTELVQNDGEGHDEADSTPISPWSQRKKLPATIVQPLTASGSTHSTPSTKRRVVRIKKKDSSVSPTKRRVSTGERTPQSSNQPPESKLLTPPKRRLVVKVGASPSKKGNSSSSPVRLKASPVKQRPPSVVLSTASGSSKASSEEEDLTSLGASLHSKQSLSHSLIGLPKKTSQALRLLRVLLNQPNLSSVTKLNVNHAIQKHMHILKELQSTRQTNQILQTQLEIAKTDSDIAKAASASAEQRLKALKWKLAKERQAAKDKFAAAAATMAMSTSIAPASASPANLAEIVAMVEKTVLSLRAKEKVLRELNGFAGNDEATAMVEQLELESKLLRQHLDPDGYNDDNDSDSTPVMGHQSSSGGDDDEKNMDAISSWPKEKRKMKRDFEETIANAERKIDQLKSVLAVCNERRLRAEEFLDKSQKEALIQFTVENQEQLAHRTIPLRTNYGSGIVVEKAQIIDDVDDDLESSQLVAATEITDEAEANEALLKELDVTKAKLDALETQTSFLTKEAEGLTVNLQSAKAEKELCQDNMQKLEVKLKETEKKVFDLLLIGKEQAFDEHQIRMENLSNELAEATEELESSNKRVNLLENELEETKKRLAESLNSLEATTRKQHEMDAELNETKNLLQTVRTELKTLQELKQPRQKVLDSRSAVRQAEAKVGEIRARILRPYHSDESPEKIRSRAAAVEGQPPNESSSSDAKTIEPVSSHSYDETVSNLQLSETAKSGHGDDTTEVGDGELPTDEEMNADMERIATIHRAFTDSQQKVESLKGSESKEMLPVSSLLAVSATSESSQGPSSHALVDTTTTNQEIVDLKRQLEEKTQQLVEAKREIAAFYEETKKDAPVEASQEALRKTLDEMNELRQQVLSSTEALNEASGKLIFLRKVVLSVVPWEDDEGSNRCDDSASVDVV